MTNGINFWLLQLVWTSSLQVVGNQSINQMTYYYIIVAGLYYDVVVHLLVVHRIMMVHWIKVKKKIASTGTNINNVLYGLLQVLWDQHKYVMAWPIKEEGSNHYHY